MDKKVEEISEQTRYFWVFGGALAIRIGGERNICLVIKIITALSAYQIVMAKENDHIKNFKVSEKKFGFFFRLLFFLKAFF